MNANTILCPKCKAEIPLTEAVAHPIREQLAREFAIRQQAQNETVAKRENDLRRQATELEQARAGFETLLANRMTEEKARLLTEARQQVQSQLSVEMQDLRNRLAEREQKLAEAQTAELGLRKQQRELQARQETLELEVNRRLDEECGKIRDAAKQQAAEEQQLRLAEKEKLIGDLQKQIDILKQKAEQGSMQMQGEVLELALEEKLRAEFIYDLIEPIGKGQRGGDVFHRVRTNSGLDCGGILWETKRTKGWGKDWAVKLKEDQRAAKAELAILVSQALPPEVQSFGQFDGVWVCDFGCALPLAAALRQGLIGMAALRQVESGKQTKMEQLYQYLAGTEFRQRVEALVETFLALRKDLDEERRVFTKRWAGREKQIEQAITQTALLYGGIQGIVGQSTLPEIKVLQLEPPAPSAIENSKSKTEN